MKFLLNFFSFLLFVVVLTASCKKSSQESPVESYHVKLSGFAEKTLFVTNADVRIIELDRMLRETSRQHQTKIGEDGKYGAELDLQSQILKIRVTGNYYDEITGQESIHPISLESIIRVEGEEMEANVNTFTHVEQDRLQELVKDNSFEKAKEVALKELLEHFRFGNTNYPSAEAIAFTDINIEPAIMVAFSTMLLNREREQVGNFLNELKKDFADGSFSQKITDELYKDADKIDFNAVRDNLIDLYKKKGHELKLEHDLEEIVVDNNYIKDEDEAIIVVKSSLESVESFAKDLYTVDAIYTRNIDASAFKGNNDYIALYNHQHLPTNIALTNLFSKGYASINKINTILRLFENANKPSFDKYRYSLLVNRSLVYLHLMDLWGDVILFPSNLNVLPTNVERTPMLTALESIIVDLKQAEEHLQENDNQYIASKYAAKALLARAYLLKNDHQKAKLYLNHIISSNKYKIEENTEIIFKSSGKECILSIPEEIKSYASPFFDRYIKKGELIPLIRYAEILLLAAECNMTLEPDANGIEAYLNPLYKRQHNTELDPRIDKFGAGEIIFGLWYSDLNKEGLSLSAFKRSEFGDYIFESPHFRLLPIPERELQLNKNLRQNPGYQL